jgi:WD40 repeat protein
LEEYRDTNIPKITGRKTDQYDLNQRGNIDESSIKIEIEAEGSCYEEIIKKQRKFRLLGHTDAVFSVSISPDKKYIISGSFDETIRLWSIFSKTTLVVYKGHFSPVLCVKFSAFS